MSLFADLKVYLRFHDNCGKNITLNNNNQTAQWTLLDEYDEWDGVVMSHDPMLTDMLYQVSETLSVSVSLSLSLSVSVSVSVSLSLSLFKIRPGTRWVQHSCLSPHSQSVMECSYSRLFDAKYSVLFCSVLWWFEGACARSMTFFPVPFFCFWLYLGLRFFFVVPACFLHRSVARLL